MEGNIAGTFAFDLVGLNHERAPDLFYVMRSNSGYDQHGLPGRGSFTDMVPIGGGLHGGLNRHELNTVLIVRSTSIAENAVSDAPAGIVDIAPTVLGLLGLKSGEQMIGRNLTLGLFDPLSSRRAAVSDPAWTLLYTGTYLFVALIYFLILLWHLGVLAMARAPNIPDDTALLPNEFAPVPFRWDHI